MRDFTGKAVLVTGGGGAIGLATAILFAKRGARVTLADVDQRRLDSSELEIICERFDMGGIVADVSTPCGAEEAVEDAVDYGGGRLDVVFNNAGIAGTVAPVHELDDSDFDHVIATNLRSLFLVQKYAARAMIAGQRGGAIVNMGSSMSGWDVLSGGAGYVTSKHGAIGLTKAAALDLGQYGIRVNAVCPGVIETKLGVPGLDDEGSDPAQAFADKIPTRRIGQPKDVAEVVLFLASDAAAHVSGAAWLIDGGQTLQSHSNGPADGVYPAAPGSPLVQS